ncbi:cysteine peptidase family C39 domain-containing protein [Spiroplasma endosymbiont of Asaphidion curtum]|uniref:cysteine peptidase family C39 domain-containing protein n=1 Tax=Spiroplasma endosymbiont of Asaphidion curtum TaxID=3066281 RepID=UPI00313AE537
MKTVAYSQGVLLTPYHCNFEQLQKLSLKTPWILYVNNDNGETHFIVVYKKHRKNFLIADPSKEKLQWVTNEYLQNIYLDTLIISAKTIILASKQKNMSSCSLFYLLQPYLMIILGLLIINLLLTVINFLANMLVKVFVDSHHLFILNNRLLALLIKIITNYL